jgi:hypothetical protein
MTPGEWAAVVSIGGAGVGVAMYIARSVAKDETRQLAERVATLEALRGEDVRRLDEIKDDLSTIQKTLTELLQKVGSVLEFSRIENRRNAQGE